MNDYEQLLEIVFEPVNLPYTILLLVICVYWVTVLIGILDLSTFDFDFDFDADIDADVDVDGDFAGLGGSVLGFLNIGEVPVMMHVSIISLTMWVCSVQMNYNLDNDNGWIAAAMFIPNFAFGLLMAKLITQPFKHLKKPKPQTMPLEGKVCLVKSIEVTNDNGQCEIATGEAPIRLNARTIGDEVLVKGDAAIVVEKKDDSNTYIVRKHTREEN